MIVVSDTSVLINLAWLNHLELLKELYEEIVIPQTVWDEAVLFGEGKPGSKEVKTASWIKTQTPQNSDLVLSLQQTLDKGEAEAIALAIEINAELLLMDERLGRTTAHYFNIDVIGLIGVLIQAKQENLLSAVKPLLDQLRYNIGFFIPENLYQEVLDTVGE